MVKLLILLSLMNAPNFDFYNSILCDSKNLSPGWGICGYIDVRDYEKTTVQVYTNPKAKDRIGVFLSCTADIGDELDKMQFVSVGKTIMNDLGYWGIDDAFRYCRVNYVVSGTNQDQQIKVFTYSRTFNLSRICEQIPDKEVKTSYDDECYIALILLVIILTVLYIVFRRIASK